MRRIRRGKKTFNFYATTQSLPIDTIPAIVDRTDPFQPLLESTVSLHENQQINAEIQHHSNLMFNQMPILSQVDDLINQIINGIAIAVSDASLSPHTNIAASSFVITTNNLQTSCSGSHGVPPGIYLIDSYGAKLYGVYTIMVYLQHIIEKKHNERSNTNCNKASINNAFQYPDKVSAKQGNFDIL